MLKSVSCSTNSFSDNVLPVETKSTIYEHIPRLEAISTAPLSFIHSARTPLLAKKLVTVFLYFVATLILPKLFYSKIF